MSGVDRSSFYILQIYVVNFVKVMIKMRGTFVENFCIEKDSDIDAM